MRVAALPSAATLALLALAMGCPNPAAKPCSRDIECSAGSFCVSGECRACPSCGEGEVCLRAQCLLATCGDRPCHHGQGCLRGACVDAACLAVTCPAGQTCAQGSCYATDCQAASCLDGEICWQQGCRTSLCQGVSCAAGETCADGTCLGTVCAGVVCGIGAACEDGRCQYVRCVGVTCGAGTICADGRCVAQGCQGVVCPAGSGCVGGQCVDARCVAVTCAAGTQCVSGGCVAVAADAGVEPADASEPAEDAGQGLDAAVPVGGIASVSAPTYGGNYSTVTYTFTGTASGGSGALTTTWTGPPPLPSSALSPTVVFACGDLAGGQTVTLTIRDASGQSATRTVSLAACPSPVSGTASVSAPTYIANYTSVTYTFTGTASGGAGALATTWTGPAPLPNSILSPTVVFACSALVGGQTVTFTVSDSNGPQLVKTVALAACPDPHQPTVFVAGGFGAYPSLVEDAAGTYLYVSGDTGVSKIAIATGAVNQIATIAQICPTDTRVDAITIASDGYLYTICYDTTASPIRRISTSGTVTPFTTVGPFIQYLTADAGGNLYYNDFSGGHVVYKMAISSKSQMIFAGTYPTKGCADGPTGTGLIDSPYGMVWNGSTLYFGDYWNDDIRKSTGTSNMTTLAGSCGVSAEVDGATGTAARFTLIAGLTSDGAFVYMSEQSGYIRRVRISNGETVTIAKTGLNLYNNDLAIGPNGVLYIGSGTSVYQLPDAAGLDAAP